MCALAFYEATSPYHSLGICHHSGHHYCHYEWKYRILYINNRHQKRDKKNHSLPTYESTPAARFFVVSCIHFSKPTHPYYYLIMNNNY
mmetsp:Transcript_10760/g.20731  ORF Transcript_10760/g.20731 Transcript_10760/m.20731 type:complete len:88 (+) Transcript_10760:1736-1999(+)